MITEIFEWHNLTDIILVAAFIYLLLSIFRGTIAAQVLKGIAILSFVVVLANFFNLETLTWIIERMATVVIIAIVVLFQPELRRGLARIGERSFGSFSSVEGARVLETVTDCAKILSDKRHGALIVFERETGLDHFIETGTTIGSEVTQELLLTIFFPKTALHDGAVIIRGNKVAAAGCLLPLNYEENVKYGTRHRAAMGLSEETDAVVVVVSEERGSVSLASSGKLVNDIDKNTLLEMLSLYIGREAKTKER